MQAQVVPSQWEPFQTAAGIDVLRAGSDNHIICFSIGIDILHVIPLISRLRAYIPCSNFPDELGYDGHVAEEKLRLAEPRTVHNIYVQDGIPEYEMVSKRYVIDEILTVILHEVDRPYGLPPWGEFPGPGQVVCIDGGLAERKG